MLIIRPIQKLKTDEVTGEVSVLSGEAALQGLMNGVVRIKDLIDVVSTETQTKSMQVTFPSTSLPMKLIADGGNGGASQLLAASVL
jgi:hypothetical protein